MQTSVLYFAVLWFAVLWLRHLGFGIHGPLVRYCIAVDDVNTLQKHN